jgi:RNA polymerase sigma factor (sigma-70 family)
MSKRPTPYGVPLSPLYPDPDAVHDDPVLFGFAVFHDALRRLCGSKVQESDFMDMTQEGCLRLSTNAAFMARSQAGSRGELRAIAIVAARNAYRRYLRTRSRRPVLPLEAAEGEAIVARSGQGDLSALLVDELKEALEVNAHVLSRVLSLIAFAGTTKSDAARELGISRHQVHRLLEKLRNCIETARTMRHPPLPDRLEGSPDYGEGPGGS